MSSIFMDGFALNVLLPISFILLLSVLYLAILKTAKHTADAIFQQFKYLKCFLPRDIQKGVFKLIAKYSIDLSSRLSTVTMDYHGTTFLLIQMHSEESARTVYDYIYTMDNSIDSLKIDALPEEYLQISTFLSDLAVCYVPKCNDPMEIPSLDSSILNEAVHQEIE